MEESGRRAGQDTAVQALQAQVQAGRSRRTYRDFLRRFAVWHEEPHLDPEEFDLGFYSYGLRTYGNLPLIEPLESREVKKIRDFVIVVDTSESTAGELVKAFLKETFTLLKSQDSFFRQCRILVMQADNAVRDEVWLNDLDALDRYTAQFTLVGGGGTDFRPAFARIAQLRQDGALRDLQGVLYFTDGKGIYPAKRPPFVDGVPVFGGRHPAARRAVPGPCAWSCSPKNLTRKDDEPWIFNVPKRKLSAPCRRTLPRTTLAAR